MFREIFKVTGSALWLIVRFILIIGLSVAALYCFGTMFFFRFLWGGLLRLGICAVCVLIVILIVRAGREDDGGTMEDAERNGGFRP